MSKIVYLFTFVALVQVATALKCHTCDKTTCFEDRFNLQKIQYCGGSISLFGSACLKQVYTDKNTNKEVIIRECILGLKDDNGVISHTCDDVKGKTTTCEICTTDLCN